MIVVLFSDVNDGEEPQQNMNPHETSETTSGVDDNGVSGLVFKCKRDRKVVRVDPWKDYGDSTKRTIIESPEYEQIVVYDHLIRRKN